RESRALPQALCASELTSAKSRLRWDTWERKSPPGRLLIKVTVGGQAGRRLQSQCYRGDAEIKENSDSLLRAASFSTVLLASDHKAAVVTSPSSVSFRPLSDLQSDLCRYLKRCKHQ
ncbi:hypothetical protein KUCAC02_001466, partial [Chaenocephalus aceratus]